MTTPWILLNFNFHEESIISFGRIFGLFTDFLTTVMADSRSRLTITGDHVNAEKRSPMTNVDEHIPGRQKVIVSIPHRRVDVGMHA